MRLLRLLKRDLAKECSNWVNDSIITQEQAEQICHRYGIDYHNIASQSYGYTVLLALGYLFIGLAVITLIGANWEDIPRTGRMLGLFALTAGTNLLAFQYYQYGKAPLATGLFFLGSLFYGASIMLIAQIYHIDEHYPNGIFWWAVGILPIALLLKSSLLIILATALAYLWLWVEASLEYYPTLFPLFLLALGWHIFKVKQGNLLFLGFVIGLGFWIELTLAWLLGDSYRYSIDEAHFIYVAGIVISFYGFAKWLLSQSNQILQDYGTLLSIWVLRFAIFTLLLFSFKWPWKELLEADWATPALNLIMAIMFSGVALILAFVGNKKIHSTIAFIAIYLPASIAVMWADDRYAIHLQIVTNVILISMGIWLIIKGIRDGLTHYFFLGVATILITGLLRYIDLVGDYIGASMLFILFAGILLGAARYWKMQQKENPDET